MAKIAKNRHKISQMSRLVEGSKRISNFNIAHLVDIT